jgi:hypothetical protein
VIPAERTPVVVGMAARAWRRAVGPTAWVVLEELVAIAQPDANGRWGASTSIRALAAELGLGRDSVDAALRRLRLAGVVTSTAPRQPADGRFGAGRYVVSSDLQASLTGAPQPDLRPVERSVRRATAAIAVEQLGLTFDDESIEDAEGRAGRLAVDTLDRDGERTDDVAGGGDGGMSPALDASTGGVGRRRHELASSMPVVAGDVGGDITGVSFRDGDRCSMRSG